LGEGSRGDQLTGEWRGYGGGFARFSQPTSPVTMSLFDQGISGAMMTSIAVSPSMAKMTATARVESD
jgi:hypothetical protein